MRDHKELYWHWLKFLKDNGDKVVLKVKHDEFLYPLRRDPFLLGDELCLWVSGLDYPLRVELILEVLVIDDDTSAEIKVFNNYLENRALLRSLEVGNG